MLTMFNARAMTVTRVILVLMLGMLFGPATARAQTEEVVYYHTDAIGSVRATTDATGAVIHRYDFLPFGESWLPPTSPDNRQFAGKERDAETGLDYFGARYHSSSTGRFTTVDPAMDIKTALTDPQRWNRYSYAKNNPFAFVDPDGRDPHVVGALIGVVVYSGWNAYVNVQQGRAWYENIGIEASKGFIAGVTLGLAAPAMAAADLGAFASGTAASGAAVAKSSSELGRIIGWGTGQGDAEVAQTIRVTRELTQSRVVQLAQQGVTREWVQKQLSLYQKALEDPTKISGNAQLVPRMELMKKLLEHLPKNELF